MYTTTGVNRTATIRTARARRARVAAGFTLVELLCVIGIVALLVGILMPTLQKARAQAREVQCATILRAWGQAFATYAAFSHGRLPHSGDRGCNPFAFRDVDCPIAPFTSNSCGYTDLIPPLMNRKPWSSYPQGQRPTADIWQCPLAQPLADAAYGYQPSVNGFHTFAMNEYLDWDVPGLFAGFKPYPGFLTVAKAGQSSVTLLMFETTLVPAQAYGQAPPGQIQCMSGLYSHENPESLGDRHPHQRGKLGGNLLMVDGHVEWTDRLWDPTLPTPSVPPQSDRRWWPYAN